MHSCNCLVTFTCTLLSTCRLQTPSVKDVTIISLITPNTFILSSGDWERERGGLEVQRNTCTCYIHTRHPTLPFKGRWRCIPRSRPPQLGLVSVPKCDRSGNVFRVSAESRGFCTLSRCLPLLLMGESRVWVILCCCCSLHCHKLHLTDPAYNVCDSWTIVEGVLSWFAAGCDWGHRWECFQDLPVSCHPLLWEPCWHVRFFHSCHIPVLTERNGASTVFSALLQSETAGENGKLLQNHIWWGPANRAAGQIPCEYIAAQPAKQFVLFSLWGSAEFWIQH